MKPNQPDTHTKALVGRHLLSLEKKDYSWFFGFGGAVCLATESPWRLIEQGRIAVSSEDHGQPFGLPMPVDAAREALSRVADRTVQEASIAADSGDLTIRFPGHVHVQLLQLSSGYESWKLSIDGSDIICTGGGAIAHYPRS